MYSRVASLPSGRRTVSRLTCSSWPSNTSSEATPVSIRCASSSLVIALSSPSQSRATRKSV